MNELAVENTLPATSSEFLEKVRAVEQRIMEMPQISVQTEHVLHAGVYARTVRLDANVIVVGTLIKIPTILIVRGHARLFAGASWYDIEGYSVIPATAGRKQICVTLEPTEVTMLFPTKARTVEEAEAEFTDEADILMSRKSENDLFIVTGEPCLE